jgi:hypothetical protein
MAENAMKVGLTLSATDKMSAALEHATRKSTGLINNLQDRMDRFKKFGLREAFVGGGVVAGLYAMVHTTEEGEASQKRLNNAMKRMWGNSDAVREFAKQQGEYAEKLALQTGVDEDIIRLTQAKLVTFEHVSSKTAVMAGIFDRANKAAIDMAAAGFGEASQNAVILGKSLEDPMKMATAMKRMGTLTAADILNVQQITKTKGLLAGQQYILKAVERQVKGAAEETATMTDKMKVGFHQVVEEAGKPLLGYLEKYKDKIPEIVGNTINWIDRNKDNILTFVKLSVGIMATVTALKLITATVSGIRSVVSVFRMAGAMFGIAKDGMLLFKIQYYGLVAVQKVAAATQWLFNSALFASPITWVVVIIGALIAAVVICWKKFAGFRAVIKTTWEVVKGFGNIIKSYVIDRIKGVISGLGAMGRAIALLFKGKFSAAGQAALQGIKDLSGYTAAQNAVKSTATLIKATPTVYNNILAKEQTKQQAKQLKPTTSVIPAISNGQSAQGIQVGQTASNRQPVVNYTQNINITPGVNADELMKTLRNNQRQFMQVLNETLKGKQRAAFG